MQLKCISKVCPGWTKEIFTQEQFLFTDPAFLKLTHNFTIILESDPGQPRGKRKAKVVYLIRFPRFAHGSCAVWWDQVRTLAENPACRQQAATALRSGGCGSHESSKAARKELRAPCSPVPGRQPLCLTLAGAQLGLEVCFNWGRGQRSGDAPTSSVCLCRSLI